VIGEAEVQGHEVGIDYKKVGKVLVDGSYNFVIIRLCQSF
jgi:hypothetical protein